MFFDINLGDIFAMEALLLLSNHLDTLVNPYCLGYDFAMILILRIGAIG